MNSNRAIRGSPAPPSSSSMQIAPVSFVRQLQEQHQHMTFRQQWKSVCTDDDDDYSDSESYTSSTSADYTTSDDEDETAQVQAMVRAVFNRTRSVPASVALLSTKTIKPIGVGTVRSPAPLTEPAAKRVCLEASVSSCDRPDSVSTVRMSMVESAPVLSKMDKRKVPSTCTVKPDDYLRSLLTKAGLSAKTYAALEHPTYFQAITDESIKAYDMQVVKAVRDQDLERLRLLIKSGHTLQCGNKFGESIVHTACRRASPTVLKFLLSEANVNCRVCCDSGRTPAHDACWTSQTNFDVMDLLIDTCPDLLHVTDSRGFAPLAYVTKEHWQAWCDYLDNKSVEKLAARELS